MRDRTREDVGVGGREGGEVVRGSLEEKRKEANHEFMNKLYNNYGLASTLRRRTASAWRTVQL